MKYKELGRVIKSYFSYNTGVNFEEWIEYFKSDLKYEPFKIALTKEVLSSLDDEQFSWLALLKRESIAFNEEIGTEIDARKWAKEQLLEKYLI